MDRLRYAAAGGGTIWSSSARSAADGIQSAAAALALTCSGEVAPAITEAHPGCAASAPMATSRTVSPRSAAHEISASTRSSLDSVR